MADLDAAIRARLAIFGNDVQGNAVRAALDIHAPLVRHPATQPEFVRCSGCSYPDIITIDWPCKTVRAIARELGLSGGTQQAGTQ